MSLPLLSVITCLLAAGAVVGVVLLWRRQRPDRLHDAIRQAADALRAAVREDIAEKQAGLERALGELVTGRSTELRDHVARELTEVRDRLAAQEKEVSRTVLEGQDRLLGQVRATLSETTGALERRFETLQGMTSERLEAISGKVDERLSQGFEKTQQVFIDVIQRLAAIDKAQHEISVLSRDVTSLHSILTDKKSRGVFGEVQLESLVRKALEPSAFQFQSAIGVGGQVVDCLLTLPPPSGKISIDSKFPLENFRRMVDGEVEPGERKVAAGAFNQDVKKHINSIADKYIVTGETADWAVMFLPSEAVFAEIHAHHPDLVELSHRRRVWITSPTTLMALLNAVQVVLREEKTRDQVHIIQEHLVYLGRDFERFAKRMDQLARHVDQAHRDVADVRTSARKLTGRFTKIEQVQLDGDETAGPEGALAGPKPAEE
ncbi:MAG: DNA recombination protein RmuC [Nitrospirota bacterium]